jgi:flagellar basal body-associated protein FliL
VEDENPKRQRGTHKGRIKKIILMIIITVLIDF